MMDEKTEPTELPIDEIVVHVDDVVNALESRIRQTQGRGDLVLRLCPPFEEKMDATTHYHRGGHYYPPNETPHPIHLGPYDFVERDRITIYPRTPVVKREVERVDMSEEEIFENMRGVWYASVENALLEEISINVGSRDAIINSSVTYIHEDEE